MHHFSEVKYFFLHWGLDCEDKDHNLLPASLYKDMLQAALKAGCAKLWHFTQDNTNMANSFISLKLCSWNELEHEWNLASD